MRVTASMLAVAYKAFMEGQDDLASELFLKACESDDADELMDALETVGEGDEDVDDADDTEDEDPEEDAGESEGEDEEGEDEEDEDEEGEDAEGSDDMDLSDAPAHVKARIKSIANRIASVDGGAHVDLAYQLLAKIA